MNFFSKDTRKVFFFRIRQSVPHIPDFSDSWNLMKILVVSFFISIIYSFTIVQNASELYTEVLSVLRSFFPYVVVQVVLLRLNAKTIKGLDPVYAITYIFLLNFLCVYFVYATFNYFDYFKEDGGGLDKPLARYAVGFGILSIFLVYFDWREKSEHPAHVKAQLSFLQSKMRPHFLFNTINSIISLIKIDPVLARKMLLNLAELLRASLRDNSEYLWTIKEEVVLSQKYLEIEKIRLGERLGVKWEVDESIQNFLIPKMSLQPLVENSVLHGIQHMEEGGVITVKIGQQTESNKIALLVSNPRPKDFVENKVNKENFHNNISLNNLKERMKICYDGNVEVGTRESKEVFEVMMVFPKRVEI